VPVVRAQDLDQAAAQTRQLRRIERRQGVERRRLRGGAECRRQLIQKVEVLDMREVRM
jgi:hypothetical protein